MLLLYIYNRMEFVGVRGVLMSQGPFVFISSDVLQLPD